MGRSVKTKNNRERTLFRIVEIFQSLSDHVRFTVGRSYRMGLHCTGYMRRDDVAKRHGPIEFCFL